MKRPCLAVTTVMAASLFLCAPLLAAARPIPVVLDTDIGDDIDDTFALLMLLRSRELDVRLVVTGFGDTVYRARLAAKLLEAMGRPDVPIGVGVRQGEKSGAISAFRRVLDAPWPMLLAPLDTCGAVRLSGPRWAKVLASRDPEARALVENYRVWCQARPEICGKDPKRAERDTTVLYDTVAVYLAFSEELVRVEETGVRVDDTGMTIPDPAAPKRRWAVEWTDLEKFEDLLVERLTGSR